MKEHDTQTMVIELDEALHAELVAEVEKQSVYVDTGLHGLSVHEDRRQVRFRAEAGRETEVQGRVQRFLEAIQRGFRPVPARTIASHTRTHSRPYETGVFDRLVEREWALDLGHGQVALCGPALLLLDILWPPADLAGAQVVEEQ